MDAALLSRIDVLQLAIDHGGDSKSIRSLLALYLATTQQTIHELELAIDTQNILRWQQLATDLKKESQLVTARRLASLCGEAEAIATLPHSHAPAVLYHLQKELALLTREIDGLLTGM